MAVSLFPKLQPSKVPKTTTSQPFLRKINNTYKNTNIYSPHLISPSLTHFTLITNIFFNKKIKLSPTTTNRNSYDWNFNLDVSQINASSTKLITKLNCSTMDLFCGVKLLKLMLFYFLSPFFY